MFPLLQQSTGKYPSHAFWIAVFRIGIFNTHTYGSTGLIIPQGENKSGGGTLVWSIGLTLTATATAEKKKGPCMYFMYFFRN